MLQLILDYGFWATLLYVVGGAFYRLYLSPLSKFPGPRLAALTLWYEFYYDVILRGQYTFHIKKLHEIYGPIVRINPYELHVSDPSYYETLYASGGSGEKRDKWDWYTKQFGTPGAIFSTVSHDQHRMRRGALNRFFSMASVRRLQPVLEDRLQALLHRFQAAKGTSEIIPLEYALGAFANDVVMEYAYGESDHRIERADWGPEYVIISGEAAKAASFFKQMIWIFHVIQSLPDWLQVKMTPGLALVFENKRWVEQMIARIKSQPKSAYADIPHPTIFHEILSSSLPESEKTVNRLSHEARLIVGAGTITTSWALCVAIFHLLETPRILLKLKKELQSAIPDPHAQTPLPTLENLPYLTGVIKEALRLSYGVPSRLQRISPDKPLTFTERSGKTWVIPKGTPVGMTSVLMHHDESIFPESFEFRPERWIENPGLEKFLVAFTKGSRQCIGMNLAYAEMYLCLSAVFRRYGSSEEDPSSKEGIRFPDDEGTLELHETTERDVALDADGFIPLRHKDSKGVRLRIRR